MSNQEIIDKSWEESQNNRLIASLRAGRDLAETLKTFPAFAEVFAYELDELDCSDGRVLGKGRKLGIAGQGILASGDDQERLAAACRGQVKCVTSHDDCGAAAIKYREMVSRGKSLPVDVRNADELGKYHTERFAKKIGAAYRHISAKDLLSSFHQERAICFDGTGRFNVAALAEMPVCFVSSAPGLGLSDEYSRTELEILTGIALGDHGFGRRFDQANPFYIIVAAKTSAQLSRLMNLAENAAAGFGGRVTVKGFVYNGPVKR